MIEKPAAGGPALAVPADGPPVGRTPRLAHECAVAGIRVLALPPGPVELAMEFEWHALNVVPITMAPELMRVGGTSHAGQAVEPDGLCWQPAGSDLRLRCVNPVWEPLLEVDPLRLDALAHEALGGRRVTGEFVFWRHDPLVAAPSRLLVEHLRGEAVDPLYVEGLAVAVVARGLRLAAGSLGAPSTRGVDARITRAVEHAEAHLERPLALAQLAAVACMSPYHFLRCFRDATGRTPAAWVRERRVARARALLRDPRLPLAQVAFACGFASQSHFGEVFRALTGATPGAYRAAVTG